jgi:NtrC-family two-component system response regulator AlgB
MHSDIIHSTENKLRALVIDDEKNIRATLSLCLEQLGCQVGGASSAESALAALAQHPYHLAFLDLRLGDANGLDLIPRLLAEDPNLSIIVMTAYATIDTAVEAIKRGAKDYIAKPFIPAQIEHVVRKNTEQRELGYRIANLEEQLRAAVPEIEIETHSAKMRAVLETALRSAQSDATILLRGESGTGKGVLARLIHFRSPRAAQPFVVVNCPTLSEELLASELFGHAKGSFTGAVRDQAGRVEAAQGGTLFLDEIGEISPALQAKLLRFLQEKQFERLGETRTRSADVRVIAATNRDLEQDV